MNHLSRRFRKFLPVVIDVETGGLDPAKDALLELAAVTIKMDESGILSPDQTHHYHILPFEESHLDPKSLLFNKIDPYHPFRFAIDEKEALQALFTLLRKECKQKACTRAVLVGHNAWFDLHFLNAAITRHQLKSPFHRAFFFNTMGTSPP